MHLSYGGYEPDTGLELKLSAVIWLTSIRRVPFSFRSREASAGLQSSQFTDARKYHERLHFLFECHWYELTSADCPDRVEPELN